MANNEEPTRCARCGRPAPVMLDGIGDEFGTSHWAEREVLDEKAADGEPAVICPGCVTRPELLSNLPEHLDEEADDDG
jgi:hypothetical protein